MTLCLVGMVGVVGAQQQQEASYNSMTRQIGYCRMQSFDTVSRETSDSVPMFLDGRISFGVGLPSRDADSMEAFTCGMCLNVTHVENFYAWNNALTVWSESAVWRPTEWFLVMVFDECKDPVCQQPFYLDFDVYSETQPVARGNPRGVQWKAVPCPLHPGETLEYLFCTASSCHVDDNPVSTLAHEEYYYWSVTIRNLRIPLVGVSVLYHGKWFPLKRENAWKWDDGPFRLDRSFKIKLRNAEGVEKTEVVSLPVNGESMPSYRGGWKVNSVLEM